MSYTLNAVSAALDCHPRTILRLTTGEPNPYWADGYDPEVDLAMIAVLVGSSEESIVALLDERDKALNVEEAAAFFKITQDAFYHRELQPDWQVGRAKRYSFARLRDMKKKG